MTASELRDLITATLVRTVGGTQRHWRIAIGAVRLHDPSTHPHCNWSIDPAGDAGQNAAIERLLDDIRLRYPHVAAG